LDLHTLQREILQSEKRIRPFIRETPVEYSPELSQQDCEVYLKLENLQLTGSFKIRGAANFILSSPSLHQKGFITASTGNHAAACAYLFHQWGIKGSIYMPENTASTKRESLAPFQPSLHFYGQDCVDTEQFARQKALEMNQTYISPYNHIKIIAGQGTVAVELMRQLHSWDIILVPVGGGGLISGIAGLLKFHSPKLTIIGCQPSRSPVMAKSIQAGRILDFPSDPTLSDGSAGGLESDAITFEICQKWVDDFILVSEKEIQSALLWSVKTHRLIIEGAAALSIAAFKKIRRRLKKKRVILVLTGNKIDFHLLKSIVCDSNTHALPHG
jgi:threonine dehydratase